MSLQLKVSCFLLGLGILLATSAFATAIRQVTMDEMLQNSELVFEGVVTGKRVLRTAQGRPYTEISFRIIDIVKGEGPDGEIRLSFLGGETAGRKLKVQEMEYPQPGEHGIYFVESLRRRQVNPLYGWSQGRFVVLPDGKGFQRIHTADGQPVTGLQFGEQGGDMTLNRGTAKGVGVGRSELGGKALLLQDFKDQLRQQVQETN